MTDVMQKLGERCSTHGAIGCAQCAENLPGPTFRGAGHNWYVEGVDHCGGAVISPPLHTKIPKREEFPPGEEGDIAHIKSCELAFPLAPNESFYYVWPTFVLKLMELDMVFHRAVLAAIAPFSVAISVGGSIKSRLSPEVIKLNPIRKARRS